MRFGVPVSDQGSWRWDETTEISSNRIEPTTLKICCIPQAVRCSACVHVPAQVVSHRHPTFQNLPAFAPSLLFPGTPGPPSVWPTPSRTIPPGFCDSTQLHAVVAPVPIVHPASAPIHAPMLTASTHAVTAQRAPFHRAWEVWAEWTRYSGRRPGRNRLSMQVKEYKVYINGWGTWVPRHVP